MKSFIIGGVGKSFCSQIVVVTCCGPIPQDCMLHVVENLDLFVLNKMPENYFCGDLKKSMIGLFAINENTHK